MNFDDVAADYARLHLQRPAQGYAVYPSLFRAIGRIDGKSALDLACGTGIVTRALRKLGAAHVVGVDSSQKMLEIAKGTTDPDSQIEYWRGIVGELGVEGSFDVITGAYALCYSPVFPRLQAAAHDIRTNLAPGGVFIGIDHTKFAGADGTALPWSLTDDLSTISGVNYFWRRETYETVMREEGLTLEWLPITPTDEGMREYGAHFWREALSGNRFSLRRCTKI